MYLKWYKSTVKRVAIQIGVFWQHGLGSGRSQNSARKAFGMSCWVSRRSTQSTLAILLGFFQAQKKEGFDALLFIGFGFKRLA